CMTVGALPPDERADYAEALRREAGGTDRADAAAQYLLDVRPELAAQLYDRARTQGEQSASFDPVEGPQNSGVVRTFADVMNGRNMNSPNDPFDVRVTEKALDMLDDLIDEYPDWERIDEAHAYQTELVERLAMISAWYAAN
ncbi:MAG: hypothetical protein AAF125_23245, partial [Chloroflexota bacterium]